MPFWEAPASFEDFIRSRYPELLRFAHVLTGDAHRAQDLVQEALERVGASWKRVHRQDDPEGYVRKTIVNRHLNHLRRLRRERLVASVPDAALGEYEPRDSAIWRLLATLPRRQRAILVLRYYADYTEAQVAEVLGCSIGTVKSNGARAMANLRAALPAGSLLAGSLVEGDAR